MSAWELVQNPGLIDAQTPDVTSDMREGCDLDSSRRHFAPVEVTVVTNYFVWESARYGYGWIWPTDESRARPASMRETFPEEVDHANVVAMLRGEKPWPN